MIRLASVAMVAAALCLGASLQGQQIQKIGLGDACPTFKLPGVDGKDHSQDEYKKDVLVLVITCNHCPVAVDYEDRIIAFTKKHNSKIDVVAINVNNLPADKMPKMKERAAEKGFNFPYLYDETQVIARKLGATVTPHFFVFNKERKLVYYGAMDDSQNATRVKTNYLEEAVTATLEGKSARESTSAFGCSVKYEKSK